MEALAAEAHVSQTSPDQLRISDILVPAVMARFPGNAHAQYEDGPVLTFAPICAEIGELRIYDDGEEATVSIEHITHHHVNPYDYSLSAEQVARLVTNDVVEFLDDLFADRVLLWSIDQGRRGGGWWRPYEGEIPEDVSAGADVFVWSRRLRSPRRSTAG